MFDFIQISRYRENNRLEEKRKNQGETSHSSG